MNRFKDANTVEEIVYQAIGAGSICWENMTGTGVFNDTLARETAEDALARLAEIGVDY